MEYQTYEMKDDKINSANFREEDDDDGRNERKGEVGTESFSLD